MIEEWRDVAGFEGRYQVSDLGRVRRWRRQREARHWGPPFVPATRVAGYPAIALLNGDTRTVRTVHRLVLDAFVGPCPDGMEACHHNGVRTDARLANLRWDTRKGNRADAVRHGTLTRGERHPFAKLTEANVRDIRASKAATRDLAALYGVSLGSIADIRARRRWKHVA